MSVSFQHVTKAFGDTVVVDDLTLEIERGEFVVLLGPSGCGKTTTLRMLAGLESVSSGDIYVDRQRVNDIPPQRRDMAMVFQSYALYPHMTVAENIGYPLRVRKNSADSIQKQVQQVADLLRIASLLNRRPRELSGGERQRVALARAIVRQPRVFLMDEPLSNLDARLRIQMRGELKHLQYTLRTTTIYVTHDQAEAMTLGTRVAVMNRGELQQFDVPLEIYNRPANRFVAEFVGSPSMNLLDGTVDGSTGRFVSGDLTIGLRRFPDNGGALTLGIRPDQLDVCLQPRDGWSPATVYVTELMGNETLVSIEVFGHKLLARRPGNFRADVGSTVWINLDGHLDWKFFDSGSGLRIEV